MRKLISFKKRRKASPNASETSSGRLSLISGAFLLSVLHLGLLVTGTLISFFVFNNMTPLEWLLVGTPSSVCFVSFFFHLKGWCGWRHQRWSVALSLIIALLVLHSLFGMSAAGYGYLVIALSWFVVMVPLPSLLGAVLAARARARLQGARQRRIAFLCATGLLIMLVGVLPDAIMQGRLWMTSRLSQRLGQADLRGDAKTLSHTRIVPTLSAPIVPGTNLIWCATFQCAWRSLSEVLGGSVCPASSNALVVQLNQSFLPANVQGDLDYSIQVGTVADGVLNRIPLPEEERARLHGLQALDVGSSGDAWVVHAGMSVHLPFQWAFDRFDDRLSFGDVEVEAFGIDQYTADQKKEWHTAQQIAIYDAVDEDNIIIELITRRQDHHLYLAKVPPMETLEQTIRSVQERVSRSQPEKLKEAANVFIPLLNFDLHNNFNELPASVFSLARQNIRFRLDERGAALKSDAWLRYKCWGKSLIFDKPFLLMIQYEDCEVPYFALWVDNAEILVKN